MQLPELPLFNIELGRLRRDAGMALAAERNEATTAWLARARSVAELLAAKNGECTIDDVLAICPRPADVNANVTGSVFKGKRWECVGFTQSKQTQRNAGTIRRWVLA